MTSHLISKFEELLETCLVDSNKSEIYLRASRKDPNILQEEFLDFFHKPGSDVYKMVKWMETQDEKTNRVFLESLIPDFSSPDFVSPGEKLIFDGSKLVNLLCPDIRSEDLELLVSSVSAGENAKEVTVSCIIGQYIKFKATGVPKNVILGFSREKYVSKKFYHISRFKKPIDKETTEQMDMKFFKEIDEGKLLIPHCFIGTPPVERRFFKDERVYHKTSRLKYVIQSDGIFGLKSNEKFVTVKEINDLGIISKDNKVFSPEVLVTTPFLEDSENTRLYCGDDVKLAAGVVDEIMVSLGWNRPIVQVGGGEEAYRQLLKNFFYYRSLLANWTFTLIDIYNDWAYLEFATNPVLTNVLINLKLEKIKIKTKAINLMLAPTATDYQTRTSKVLTNRGVVVSNNASNPIYNPSNYYSKQKEEEEMAKKKKKQEEEERLRLEEEDRKFGTVDLSSYNDKLVEIVASTEEVLGYLNGKKGKVDKLQPELGRIVIEFPDKKIWFRASQGHLKYIKILSGLVVSSEEHPDLV